MFRNEMLKRTHARTHARTQHVDLKSLCFFLFFWKDGRLKIGRKIYKSRNPTLAHDTNKSLQQCINTTR